MKQLFKWYMFFVPILYVFRIQLFAGNEEFYIVFSLLTLLLFGGYAFLFFLLAKKIAIPIYLYIYGCFICFLAITLLYLKYTFMIPSAFSLLLVYVVLVLVTCFVTTSNLFWDAYKSFSNGMLLLCLLLSLFSYVSLFELEMIDNRFGWVAFSGVQLVDPNYFAVFIGLAMFYHFFTWQRLKGSRRILSILVFLVLGYFFLATLSRGVVVVFILTIWFSSLMIHRKKISTILALYLWVFIIILIAVMVEDFGAQQAYSIQYTSFDRFLLLDSSNRVDLWLALLGGFTNSSTFTQWFGNGFQSGSSLGAKYYLGFEPSSNDPIFLNPHNMYIQFLLEIGLVGLFLFLIILCLVGWQVYKNLRAHNYIPLYFFIFFLGVNVSLNILGFRELTFCFMTFFFSSLQLKRGVIQ